jgi:signal transduction histidine kinase
MAPSAVLAASGAGQAASGPWLAVAGALAAFGVFSGAIRRAYRHTTHAMRLVLLFGALAGPPLVTYPLTAAAADEAARALIEAEFAPAVLSQPQVVLTSLTRAQEEIDALPQLDLLIATAPQGDGSSAYAVWSRTSLATARLTSEVELFGADRRLVSRFALNVPEYPYGDEVPTWEGTSCTWDVFGEVARTGAQERVMLHAERAVCDAQGAVLGAIVVHAVSDYRALPFIGSGSPYWEALRTGDEPAAGVRLAGLELAVYGWNDSPLFTSGGVAWPIQPDISDRLYRSRDPFWTSLDAGGTPYAVYFANDRRGFYALGYPYPEFMEHATRLAEITAVIAALLVLLLVGATAYVPLLHATGGPLPALIHEIRTSFYRKLFLFFVLSAVGPIILLALAFGAYTSARIRADVESEAANAVTITRRLFEEFAAFEQHPDEEQAPVSDALMVLIRQMTNQDANLYVGSRLAASSQRDLFDSGLLPTRTPSNVYREIALHRLPAFVGEDRIGGFTYLVAAAPIPVRGRHAVITVPLGTRQREIEHEIDELNRRVLVGAVVVVLFAAGLGASVAGRVSDPVARLTRAARQIAAGHLDVRIVADTADELRRLVDDFNVMAATLAGQRAELARSNQLKAWAQMARQVAHEIKNPLTPIQLAAEHLQRVHEDQGGTLGPVVDRCVATILGQVRLLRQIASDFSNFAAEPTPRFETVAVGDLVTQVVQPYRPGATDRLRLQVDVPDGLPPLRIDRTLVARALTNLIENALQAMPQGGRIAISARPAGRDVTIAVADTGVGMDPDAASRAFEPYFSTKTGGSGLGLPNAKRYVELSGGSTSLTTAPGEGTTITLTLPAAAPGGAAAAPPAIR